MPRKKDGEGTIYNHPSRGWHVQFYGLDGRRVTRKARPNTERGALATLHRLLRERDSGELAGRTRTLESFAREWLAIKRTAGCRPRTLEAYRERLDVYVLPTLGKVQLSKLTAAHLDRLYATLLGTRSIRKRGKGAGTEATLSPPTVRAVHDTLRGLLRTAKKRRLVGVVATELVEPPKVEKYEARTLTIDEARTLIKGVADHRHGNLWIFMLGTGCRFGEAAGLTWGAVDLDRGLARIYQQVTRERAGKKVKYVLAPVKTEAGRRVVPLPPFVVAALKRQRQLIDDLAINAGELWRPDDNLVFPSVTGGLLRENDVLVTWHRAMRSIGLEGDGKPTLRHHDLRHSKGTLMADAGEDTTTIQKTLGHARQSITADLYIGNTPAALKASAERFGRMLEDDDEDS